MAVVGHRHSSAEGECGVPDPEIDINGIIFRMTDGRTTIHRSIDRTWTRLMMDKNLHARDRPTYTYGVC